MSVWEMSESPGKQKGMRTAAGSGTALLGHGDGDRGLGVWGCGPQGCCLAAHWGRKRLRTNSTGGFESKEKQRRDRGRETERRKERQRLKKEFQKAQGKGKL